MDIRDLGEFGLIERLRKSIGDGGERLVLGPGDDAAVWRSAGGYTISTTDTLVAGVHFLPEKARWSDVGWKALAVNISDIAAMGGTPSFALVTLVLPPDTRVDDIDALYAGLRECAEAYGVDIAGGDVVSGSEFTITVALTGDAGVADDGSPLLLRRDAARPGDVVAVTGELGGSAGGLRALIEGTPRSPAVDAMIGRHTRPQPRIDAGRAAIAAGIRCAIDVSDGLMQDLGHICAASGVGAEIDAARVPVDPAAAATYPDDALTLAASGGEDYELVLVGAEATIAGVAGAGVGGITTIGRIVGGGGVRLLDAGGDRIALPSVGWDHLAPTERTPA